MSISRSLVVAGLLAIAAPAMASPVLFSQTILATLASDPNLQNPWGLTATATSPFWIGNNGSGTSELYNGTGGLINFVKIPGDGSVTGVTVGGTGFNGDTFLFASEDGTVSGWRGAIGLGNTAEVLQTGASPNVYKGDAFATIGTHGYLYLANFGTGNIDVLKGDGGAPNLTGTFTDPALPATYAPFDIQNLNGVLYVSYAVQKSGTIDDQPGLGNGIVDKFDLQGNFLGRVVSNGGLLDSPWGMAIAPTGFGDLAGDLLVGNFGDGLIHAYTTGGTFVETLMDGPGDVFQQDGLWALRFGNGANGASTTGLFFTAGPDDEEGGVFGRLDPAPEPTTILLLASGLAATFARRRHKRAM